MSSTVYLNDLSAELLIKALAPSLSAVTRFEQPS